MNTEEPKALIRWYVLGAVGGVLMAAGDWLLAGVHPPPAYRHGDV